MKFNLKNSPYQIFRSAVGNLNSELNNAEQLDNIIYSFRDENYDSKSGGYHPVEIRLIKQQDLWSFDYITDFTYVGCGYSAELTKEIDFDFTNGIGFHMYTGEHPLKNLSELFDMWQKK